MNENETTLAPPPFPLVWDNTMRVTFVTCPQKFWWEHMRKLASAETSIHLHFGGCFAKGMEVFRRSYYSPGPDEHKFDIALATGLQAMIGEWGDYEIGDIKTTKTFDNLCLAYDRYFQEYPPNTDIVQPYMGADGKPAVEYRFAIPLPILHPATQEPLIYAGRFDLLGLLRNQAWVVDEKTTTYLGAQWMNQWDLRSQFIGYTWACRQHGIDAQGAIVRGVGVKNTGIDFAQPIVPIADWKIERWYGQLLRDLRRAIDCYNSATWDVNYAGACTEYGGCPFRRLCDTVDPEPWVDNYYVTRHWNPLQADPTAPAEDAA
jgi:hypothetical protein